MAKLSLPAAPPSHARLSRWLPLIFLLPLMLGLIAKIYRSKYWFGDYQAVACAGLKMMDGAPIYDLHLQCAGMTPSVFVYIPLVAQIAAVFEYFLTEPGFFLLYLAAYLAAIGLLIFVPFAARRTPGNWIDKMPFAVFLSGSAIMWGNIAVLLHAGILAGALALEITPWLFVLAVVIAAWVKPVFLTYLIVILIADLPVMRRLWLAFAGIMFGLMPTVIFALTGGALADQWYGLLSHFVYDVTPGSGFFGWAELIGFDSNGFGVKAVYLGYATALALSGIALAKGLRLNGAERLWLGLSLGVLLVPRIMSQDIFLLGPGLWVVAQRTRQVLSPLHANGAGILLALCSVALAGALTGLGDYSEPIALLGFSLYLIWTGGGLLVPRAWRLVAPLRRLAVRKPSFPGE